MDTKLVQFPMEVVEVKSTRTLKNVLQIKLETQELPQGHLAVLMSFAGVVGYCVLSEANLMPEEIDVPGTVHRQSGEKSPSQRLRGVLS